LHAALERECFGGIIWEAALEKVIRISTTEYQMELSRGVVQFQNATLGHHSQDLGPEATTTTEEEQEAEERVELDSSN
jgi:chemotaxis protein CheY-P-specific phosphatase CheC